MAVISNNITTWAQASYFHLHLGSRPDQFWDL